MRCSTVGAHLLETSGGLKVEGGFQTGVREGTQAIWLGQTRLIEDSKLTQQRQTLKLF